LSITLTQLSTFLTVARTGSVKEAAAQLVVTQPSVSAALAALSREVGVGLTERVGRSIRLTPAGEAFVPYAADVLGLLEQGRRASGEAAGAVSREVRIAAVTTAAEHVVPPLLRRFADDHPEIVLTLEVGNRERVFQRVLDHEADVAIGGSPPEDGRLVGAAFMSNEIVLIVGPDDPLRRRRAVTLGDLADRTWLLREEGSGTRALVERLLDQHGIRPSALTLGSNGAIKQGVRSGLGISIQARAAVALELETGLLATAPLRGLPVRHWYALTAKTAHTRPPVQRFLEFVATDAAAQAVAEAADAHL
jgi:DNA-binding transcriptional LysR family regulator